MVLGARTTESCAQTGMMLRSTNSPRVGPLVLVLLSTLVGNVGACWAISSGTCTRSYLSGDECVQSGNYPNDYDNNDRCSFRATGDIDWYFTALATEFNYDKISIYQQFGATIDYSGTIDSNHNSHPRASTGSSRQYGTNGQDGRFEWSSDESMTGSGWRICASSCASSPSPPSSCRDYDYMVSAAHNRSCASLVQWLATSIHTCDTIPSSAALMPSYYNTSASFACCASCASAARAAYGNPSPPPLPSPSPPASQEKKTKLASYILCGVLGLFGLTLLVLLIVSRFTEKAKPQPNRTGTPNADRPEGWGPFGFLFPKSWVYVWWGYLAMVVASSFALPAIFPKVMPDIWAEPAEIILLVGPCVHCLLMPFLWVHKHREDKKWIENHLNDDVVVATALDPEAKTTIFSRKLTCGMKCKVFLLKFTLGLVNFVLRIIKYSTGGVIDLSAFWFPAPFYNFWEAKMQIDLIQINGAKICTNATQADAYMKFCTEAVLNFWTLGFYGKCCKGRTSYGRWLDRHVLWQGKPPEGYNNRESAPVSNSLTHPSPLNTCPCPIRVSHLQREAVLRPEGQDLLRFADAHPVRWVPREDSVCRASSNTSVF